MASERIRFGPYVLDVSRYELTCAGKPVRMERIPMDLLILLVRENGRLVSRDEIIERLSGKDLYFDTDNSINTAIRKIRRALGEQPEKPQYIETVQGKGYRFKGGMAAPKSTPTPKDAGRPRLMLAVLPFENLSGDAGQEYFSDGLTEEVITHLGKMSPNRLGVIARTSSMAYKHTDKMIDRIGEELGVDYVLEGSVRREPNRIRVTAQLIRVQDQIHMWAESFDRPPQSILDIHGELGAAIAAQVKLKLTPKEEQQLRGVRRNKQEAYDCYLHGRYHWARLSPAELSKAADYFRRATQSDPEYALAYSGLADTLSAAITSEVPSKEAFPEAKAAIATALALDPDSAEAHTADATIKFWYDWDFDGAEAAARKAVSLNSNYSLAHLYLAHVLSNTGRHEEALATIEQARMLDPFSLITNTMYGQFLYHAGQLNESIQQFRKTLDIEWRFWIAHICLAKTCEQQGMYSEALAACDAAWELSGGNSEALSIAGYVHAISGEIAKAQDKIQQLLEQKAKRYVPPYSVALVFAGLRDTEAALHWLEQAFEDRDVHMPFLLDHKWSGLRSNAQFRRILSGAGFSTSLARPGGECETTG